MIPLPLSVTCLEMLGDAVMSRESKHTAGPWVVYADVPSTDPNWHIVTTENRLRVVANVHIEPGNQMDAANARLIAAAPGMLQALKDIAKQWPDSFAARTARAAIAEAEAR